MEDAPVREDAAAVTLAENDGVDEGRALHARLLAGSDPTAPSDLFLEYLDPLVSWLSLTFSRLDPRTVEELAIDTLAKVAQAPAQFDPTRRSLMGYLRMDARGDALNEIQKAERRKRHEFIASDVELEVLTGNTSLRVVGVDADDADEGISALLEAVRLKSTPEEWEVLQLMTDGERQREQFAIVLKIQDLPVAQQEREVKRVKDRIKKRVQRLREREARRDRS